MEVALPKFDKGEMPSHCKNTMAYLQRGKETATFKNGSYPQEYVIPGWEKKVNTV